ncbi:serine hydrolase domain-containing protein [Crossiella cryophila]|uniref:CubicO group peptidase (Beta-lactamase class C family) n=1 Tax=Crossiella cryophila TaxID=43355 RepID=A0A7W7FUX7_9PSEU|nr:serine hydrolase domain-containing protein [Crossiella cryophila]MBB4679821.1 CubicO group peptidase (beta-lactamase class C family) [Crossiella cryophila]
MTEVHGTVAAGYEQVRAAFTAAQAHDPGGAQLAVYRHGEPVVDLWATPFEADTIGVTMSCSKGLVATMAHLLSERGQLDLAAPVARYWPEFAANGKEQVTVTHLLTHQAGLPGFPPERLGAIEDLLDWRHCTGMLAGAAPLWTPGTAFAYHAATYGYLLGEVIRRITGLTVGQYFAKEIAEPLGLDLWIGLPESQEHRVIPQYSTAAEPSAAELRAGMAAFGIDPDAPLAHTMLVNAERGAGANELLNSRAGHAAEIPAGNGIGTARALARMYAATIGEVDGIRLLQRETVDRARTPHTDGLGQPAPFDRLPQPHPLRFGLGYELTRTGSPMLGAGSFGHAGAGGRLGFAHPESGLAVGYTCANMAWRYAEGPEARWLPWLAALAH